MMDARVSAMESKIGRLYILPNASRYRKYGDPSSLKLRVNLNPVYYHDRLKRHNHKKKTKETLKWQNLND